MLETVGDTMRATIDGKPVAFLQSPGIAHPTKSKVEFGCAGKDPQQVGQAVHVGNDPLALDFRCPAEPHDPPFSASENSPRHLQGG